MRHLPRFVTVAVLILWTLVGPIGMAFDGCAATGGMCEGPCAVTTIATMPVAHSVPLPLLDTVAFVGAGHVPAIALRVPDLPPKSPLTA